MSFLPSLFTNIKKTRKKRSSIFKQVPIGLKFMLTFTISALLFIGASIIVFVQLQDIKSNVSDIIEKNQLTNDMAQLALLIEKQNTPISDYIIVGNRRSI